MYIRKIAQDRQAKNAQKEETEGGNNTEHWGFVWASQKIHKQGYILMCMRARELCRGKN